MKRRHLPESGDGAANEPARDYGAADKRQCWFNTPT